MVYVVLAFLIVLTAILLLRLRVRFELSHDRRLLFVGLGHSGPEFDFANRVTRVKLLGFTVKSIPRLQKSVYEEEREERGEHLEKITVKHEEELEKLRLADRGKAAPPSRQQEGLALVRENRRALWDYLKGLWHAIAIEELEGQVRGGFDRPDITGQAYGYYHALMGAVPAFAGRFQYVPDWLGGPFTGSMRVTVAVPLYVVVYRTIVLLIQLPVRRILQFVRGKKKGVQNGAE